MAVSAGATAIPSETGSELGEAIIRVCRTMVGVASRSLDGAAEDVTLPQYRTLVVLALQGPRRLADLAAALDVSPSTATRMCDRLVRKGLVDRTRDALDRREVNLALTAAGQSLVDQVIERRRQEVDRLLQVIPVEERAGLLRYLTLLADAAGVGPEPHWSAGWA